MKSIYNYDGTRFPLDGDEWFVTMTDVWFSGWGHAQNKTCKRVIICKSLREARILAERVRRPKNKMKRVNICCRPPRYSSKHYVTCVDVFYDKMFDF